MQDLAERLGEGVLKILEQLVPSADRFEDHRLLIGRCLIVTLALIVVWSVSGLVRK
jgi:hypothetical protein